MSLDVFKKNMLSYMQYQPGIKHHDEFAKRFTMEYDMAVRRGFQTINQVMVQEPNTELMEKMIQIAGIIALQKKSGLHDIINQYGKGIEMYWLGAKLYQYPVPIIPAAGAFQNIMTTSAFVTNPGKFPDMKQQYPTNDSGQFLDMLILGIQIHLLSIEGIYNTVSLYPGFPTVPPAPGIVNWKGFTIQAASSSPPIQTPTPQEPDVEVLIQSVPEDNMTVEGSRAVVAQTGVNILDDDGQDGGVTINDIKSKLPKDNPPFEDNVDAESVEPDKNNEENKDITCGDDFDYNIQLSPSFKVRHLSLQPTFPHRIKPQHGLSREDIVCNLKSLSENILEPIKQQYPNMVINSAFRGTPSIPGRVSQHEKGEAVDIQFVGLKPKEYLPIAKWIASTLPVDQIIFEHGNSIWLHISNKKSGVNRKSTLTMYKGNYSPGITCYYS